MQGSYLALACSQLLSTADTAGSCQAKSQKPKPARVQMQIAGPGVGRASPDG